MLTVDTMGNHTHTPNTHQHQQHSTNKRRNSECLSDMMDHSRRITPSPNKILRVSSEEFTSTIHTNEHNSMKLAVTSNTHAYPFINSWFPITISLLDNNDELVLDRSMPISMESFYGNGDVCHELNGFQIHPSTPLMLSAYGQMTIQIRFLQLASASDNKGIMFKFSTPLHQIQPCFTVPFTTVIYRMKIIEQPPSLVYKDTPLRSFIIKALLVDQNEMIVRTNEMPLDVVICYADTGAEIQKQSILYKLGTKMAKIDNGSVELKLRIDEVSKNHNGREFAIRLRPSLSTDIAPDTSTPIDVKSRPRRASKNNNHFTSAANTENVTRVASEISEWCNLAFTSIMACEWQYQRIDDPTTGNSVHLLRCPVCGANCDNDGESSVHADNCSIFYTKQRYSQIQLSLQTLSNILSDAPLREETHSPRSANTIDTSYSNDMATDREQSLASSTSSSINEVDWLTNNPIIPVSRVPSLISTPSTNFPTNFIHRISSIDSAYFKLSENNVSNIPVATPIYTESNFGASPIFEHNYSQIATQGWLAN